jgi:Animal haem peroxidase
MEQKSAAEASGVDLKSTPGQHGDLRGIERVSTSSIRVGTFGRMFRHLEAAHDLSDNEDRKALHALGEAMKGKSPDQDLALGKPDPEENDNIASGYTYLGQFIDHDLTYDPVSSFTRVNDPEARTNFRTPSFDLDSLYGRGPAHQPYLYQNDDCKLLLGPRLHDEEVRNNSYDLPRAQGFNTNTGAWEEPSRALIGDPRNDQNRIVSQIHSLFLEFHNAQVKAAEEKGLSRSERFLEAQRLTRWHYQWIVLHDFLPKVVDEDVMNSMWETIEVQSPTKTKRVSVHRSRPQLLYYRAEAGAYIPIEFSVAAYRFGHAMVRPTYHFNHRIRTRLERSRNNNQRASFRTPIIAPPEEEHSLLGLRRMPDDWAFDWDFFFRGGKDEGLVQPSYRIDTLLSEPLYRLTEARIAHDGISSLADRTLFRGAQLGLPSAESVAQLMGLTPLDDVQLYDQSSMPAARKVPLGDDARRRLKGRTPLWYYVLREAEFYQGGERLGPVGSRIVGEVLIGLLFADKYSFVNLAPGWTPGGHKIVDGRPIWGMRELIDQVRTARS